MTTEKIPTTKRASVVRAAGLLNGARKSQTRQAREPAKPPKAPAAKPAWAANMPADPPAAAPAAKAPAPEKPGGWLSEAIERGRTEGPHCMIAVIGKAEARQLLRANPENRHITISNVAGLVRDLTNGAWQFNGESIVVADTGELNDGQHRLAAVENTGIPIRTVIVFGVPRASRETLDLGKKRGLADWLALRGVANATNVAACARMVMAYERARGADFARLSHFSVAELLDRATDDKGIHQAAMHANALYYAGAKALFKGTTVIATCLYLLERAAGMDGRNFVDRVCLGDQLTRGSAAYETRRTLMMLQTSKRATTASILLWGWHNQQTGKGGTTIEARWPLPKLETPPNA